MAGACGEDSDDVAKPGAGADAGLMGAGAPDASAEIDGSIPDGPPCSVAKIRRYERAAAWTPWPEPTELPGHGEFLVPSATDVLLYQAGELWNVPEEGGATSLGFAVPEALWSLLLVDLDGDGDPEGLTAEAASDGTHVDASDTTVSLVERSGETWSARSLLRPGRAFAVADFDENGSLDVVAGQDQAWKIALGRGELEFDVESLALGPEVAGASVEHVYPADMNRDGHVDLVALMKIVTYMQGEDHFAFVLTALGRGDGTFDAGVRTTMRTTQFPRFASELRDFTGDEVPDFVMQVERWIWLLAGKADGTFADRVEILETANSYGTWNPSLAVADVDGDGRPDLAGPDLHAVWTLLSRGGSTFEAEELAVTDGEVQSVIFEAAAEGRPRLVVLSDHYTCPDD